MNKNTIEYLSNNLFYKSEIIGFQFTAGNTPLGIKEKRTMNMSASLTKTQKGHGVVIDCSERDLVQLIETEIFGNDNSVNLDKIRDLQKQFKELGYHVEERDFAGMWYWFRIKCTYDEILHHVKILKENLILNK